MVSDGLPGNAESGCEGGRADLGLAHDLEQALTRESLISTGCTHDITVGQPGRATCDRRVAPEPVVVLDASQFEACAASKYAYAIIDLVSRKWIATILTGQPDSVAVRVLFTKALNVEGLLDDRLRDRLTDIDAVPDDDDEGGCRCC